MAYLSFYRKYRPQTFAELVGQPHIATALTNAIRLGKTVHAYLLTGPRGTGKTTTARILAKALDCEAGPTPEPCGTCEPCRAITDGTALDVLELDAASNRGIDEIRKLRDQVRYTPTALRHKVYILDEAHELTRDASNALLKTLEEPPERTVFILCTTEPHKLLPTIRSRCQRYDFRRVRAEESAACLARIAEQEGLTADGDALLLLARLAEGSLRDAIGLLDQLAVEGEPITVARTVERLGLTEEAAVTEFADAVLTGDWSECMQRLDVLVQAGRDVRYLLEQLTEHFREVLLLRLAPDSGQDFPRSPERLDAMRQQSERASIATLRRILRVLAEAERRFITWGNPRLAFELILLELCQPEETMTATARPDTAASYSAPAEPAPVVVRETPSPLERPPVPDGGPTLEYFQEYWRVLLGEIKERLGPTVVAFLREAEPLEWKDGLLTLAFTGEFHRDAVEDEARKPRIEQTLAELVGGEVRVRGLVRQPADDPVNDAAATVLTVFPGSEVVER